MLLVLNDSCIRKLLFTTLHLQWYYLCSINCSLCFANSELGHTVLSVKESWGGLVLNVKTKCENKAQKFFLH